MKLLFYILVNLLIIGLFLFSKLAPYKTRLTGTYLKTFNFFESLFNPLLNLLKKITGMAQVGNGLSVDMSQIALLVLLLLILNLLK